MNEGEKPALRRYFFDTEFNDDAGGRFEVDFISIGIVDEEGNEYYGISNEFNVAAASSVEWLKENVVDKLGPPSEWKSVDQIRQEILDFVQPAEKIELWAKNGSYDNVLLCQIFGGMGKMYDDFNDKGIERSYFRDMHEMKREAPDADIRPMPESEKHIAINDARNERYVFEQCKAKLENNR